MRIARMLLAATAMLATAACLANTQDSPEVKQWQVFEVKMTAAQSEENRPLSDFTYL